MTTSEQTATRDCPNCGKVMKLEARPRPGTGIMFVTPKQWRCTNPDCDHTEDAG